MGMLWDFIAAAGLVWKRFGSGTRTASQSVISAGYYRGAERLKKKEKACFEEDRKRRVGRRYKWEIREL
jgi:hypothetical protein